MKEPRPVNRHGKAKNVWCAVCSKNKCYDVCRKAVREGRAVQEDNPRYHANRACHIH